MQNTPSPLIPQGALETQRSRSTVKIVVSGIFGLHVLVLGGLLFLGCQRDDAGAPESQFAANETGDELPMANDYADLPGADEAFNSTNEMPFSDVVEPITSREPLLPGTNEPLDIPDPMLGNPGASTGTEPGGFAPRGGLSTRTSAPATFAFTNQIPVERPVDSTAPSVSEYSVSPGDTFTSIARDHGITVRDISAANPRVDPRKLQVGQKLILPANVAARTPTVPMSPDAASALGETVHTVVSGDTLIRLAREYNTTVREIQRANNLSGSLIRVGQKLVIPAPQSN